MSEGLIGLAINLVLSYVLIKYYGILGAAIGSTISMALSSVYIYFTSVRYFSENVFAFSLRTYLKPVIISIFSALVSYAIYVYVLTGYRPVSGRASGIIYMLITGIIFTSLFVLLVFKMNYLDSNDMSNLKKFGAILNPRKKNPTLPA
jgi:putative peptidoglycan lipid II flippase